MKLDESISYALSSTCIESGARLNDTSGKNDFFHVPYRFGVYAWQSLPRKTTRNRFSELIIRSRVLEKEKVVLCANSRREKKKSLNHS